VLWLCLSQLSVVKDTTLWLNLLVVFNAPLVQSALLPLLLDQLALQVNTQWRALPFAWTALRENIARVALLRIVVLAPTAHSALP